MKMLSSQWGKGGEGTCWKVLHSQVGSGAGTEHFFFSYFKLSNR